MDLDGSVAEESHLAHHSVAVNPSDKCLTVGGSIRQEKVP